MFRANVNCKPDNGGPSVAVYLPLARKYINAASTITEKQLKDEAISAGGSLRRSVQFLAPDKESVDINRETGVNRRGVVTILRDCLPGSLLATLDACKFFLLLFFCCCNWQKVDHSLFVRSL